METSSKNLQTPQTNKIYFDYNNTTVKDNCSMAKLYSDVLFSCEVMKKKGFFFNDYNQFVVTPKMIYEVNGEKALRSVPVKKLKSLIYSTTVEHDLVICLERDVGMQFVDENREEMIGAMQLAYFKAVGINLVIYKVEGPLDDYVTTKKDLQTGREHHISDEYRDAEKDKWIEDPELHKKKVQFSEGAQDDDGDAIENSASALWMAKAASGGSENIGASACNEFKITK